MNAIVMRELFGESWQVLMKVGLIAKVETLEEALKYDRFLAVKEGGYFLIDHRRLTSSST